MPTHDCETLFNVKQAAERLGIQQSTVRAWCLRRKIGFHKLGAAVRISEKEIQRLLNEGFIPAKVTRQ